MSAKLKLYTLFEMRTFLRVILCKALDKLFQLVLQPNSPCMIMSGDFCPSSAAVSYDVYDILMGSSFVLSHRPQLGVILHSLNKFARNKNATDLYIVNVCVNQCACVSLQLAEQECGARNTST